MTVLSQSPALSRPRYFPSSLALVAAAELILIAGLLSLTNTDGFYPAAIACSLCSIQLGVLLINRFSKNTRNVRRLARTAEFSSQSTFITDPSGRIKWTNAAFSKLMGFGLSEVSGKTFSMVMHGQKTETRSVEKMRERMRLELPFDSEVLVYDRAGVELWISIKGIPVQDERGTITHYLMTQANVTEERLQSQQIIDALTKPAESEPSAAEMTSQRVEELTRQLRSLSGTDERDQLQSAVDALSGGIEVCSAELPLPPEKVAVASSMPRATQE